LCDLPGSALVEALRRVAGARDEDTTFVLFQRSMP